MPVPDDDAILHRLGMALLLAAVLILLPSSQVRATLQQRSLQSKMRVLPRPDGTGAPDGKKLNGGISVCRTFRSRPMPS